MANQDLLNYIRETKKQGFSNDEIRDALLNAGWRIGDIKDAFDYLREIDNVKVVIKKKILTKNKLVGVVIAGFIFIFTASSAFGGYYYYNTIPVRTLDKMKEKSAEIKSFGFASTLKFTSSDKNFDMQLDSSGAADLAYEKNPVSHSSHNLEINSTDGSGNLALDVKGIGGTRYFRLNIIQESDNFGLGAIAEISGIQNKWIKVDPEEIKDIVPNEDIIKEFVPTTSLLPEKSGQIPLRSFLSANILGSMGIKDVGEEENSSAQPKKIESLEDIIKNYHLFKVKEYLGKEIIQNDIKARHIQFDLDKSELIRLIMDNYSQTALYNLEDYQKEAMNELDAVKTMSGDIWIGADDSYLYKMALQILIDDKETGGGEMDFVIEFSDINKPVSVQAPENAESILDFLEITGLNNKHN